MKKRNVSALLATVAAGVMLAGCGFVPTTTKDGQVGFPDPKWASVREGTFVNVENLRNMELGLSKDQVISLIGAPHFQEGFVYVHVWNYLFDFRLRSGAIARCQYQVQFDNHMRVKATYWHNPRCGELVNSPGSVSRPVVAPVAQTPVVPAPAPAPAPAVQRVRLSGDVSFDTDKTDLKPGARSALDSLIAHTNGVTFDTVVVNGYTDSTGDARRNQDLSGRRAVSVARYLQQHGLKARHYEAHGYGAANPVATNTTDAGRAQNRRVDIELRQ